MRILVTGANGFVGRAVCAQAVRAGLSVRGAVREPRNLPDGVESVVVGKIDDATDWAHALDEVDVVIHLAARVHVMQEKAEDPLAEYRKVNLAGTECLARASAASGVKRLVYVSSIKVNGERTWDGSRFSEADVEAPIDSYGTSKWEAEQVLHRIAKETGLEVVIVRPPLVYGAGVKANFEQMIKILARGAPLPLASARNSLSLMYVGNLADVLIACAAHPAAAGQTYLVSDGEDISTADLLRRLGSELGRPARLFPCPQGVLEFAGRLTGRSAQVERLLGSLQIDSEKVRRDLDWMPPYSLQEGLQETAQWYRNTCK